MPGKKYQPALLVGRVNPSSLDNLLEQSTTRAQNPKMSKMSADDLKGKKEGKKGGGDSKKLKPKKVDLDLHRKNVVELSSGGPCPVDASGEHHHYHHHKNDRLDKIVQDLLSQHKEKEGRLLEGVTTQADDLKAQYSSAMNSSSVDEMKEMLTKAIRENFELKQELLVKDAKFLELQLDQINCNLRKGRPSRLAVNPSKQQLCQVLEEASEVEKDLKVRLAKTEIDLIEKSHILREAGARMVMLEEKCERLEAENVFLRKTHENCVKSLRAKNVVLEKRCEKTDARRKLERAGLSEEIRECKWLLRSLTRNVAKCAKLYSDAKMELKGRPGGRKGNVDLELTLVEEPSTNNKPDRLTNWLVNTNPKVAQAAMSVWTEYLGRQVNTLEEKVARVKGQRDDTLTDDEDDEMQFLYRNRKQQAGAKGKSALADDGFLESSIAVDSSFDVLEGNAEEAVGVVAPSPTWLRICRKAGLDLNSQHVIINDHDESKQGA